MFIYYICNKNELNYSSYYYYNCITGHDGAHSDGAWGSPDDGQRGAQPGLARRSTGRGQTHDPVPAATTRHRHVRATRSSTAQIQRRR